jgi:hypothetical protein
VSELTRYWITLLYPPIEGDGKVVGLWGRPHGFGVTALGIDDALSIIRSEFFDEYDLEMPPVREVVENVDVSTLDEHVRPNMRPPNWRGLWFPATTPLR